MPSTVTFNKKEYEVSGPLETYIRLCCAGTVSGAVIGTMIGMTVGTTVAAASPAIAAFAAYKLARRVLKR